MADQGKARGRARGRTRQEQGTSRPGPPQQQAPRGPPQGGQGPGSGPRPQPVQPAPAWGPQAQRPQPPPAWGPGARAQQQAPPSGPPRPQAPNPQGRATSREPQTGPIHEGMQRMTIGPAGDAGTNEGSNGSAVAGRGSVRGRRQLPSSETLFTRPRDMTSKKGLAGTPCKLMANYFAIKTRSEWCLYQYRVDFAPEEERTTVKKMLFRQAAKDLLSGYLFDGSMMFTSRRLQPDPTELFVNPPEGSDSNQPIRITIR